jgi:hypothetical protein
LLEFQGFCEALPPMGRDGAAGAGVAVMEERQCLTSIPHLLMGVRGVMVRGAGGVQRPQGLQKTPLQLRS